MKFPRLFGRAPTETKESRTGAAMVMTPGQPAWSARDYRAFADEAYRKNVVAYQAINRIADAVGSVRWTAWRGKKELADHPILKLLERPNPAQNTSQYLQAKVGYLMLSGNGYEERIVVSGEVREMYQLRPDRMKIVPGGNGFPMGYQYENAGRKVTWEVDQATMDCDVHHIRMFNPLDDWGGLSPVEADMPSASL